VAYEAHIGGFVFGAGVAWTLKRRRIEERFLQPSIASKTEATLLDNAGVDRALDAHRQGRHEAALAQLGDELRRDPGNRDAALALWTVCQDLGEPSRAAQPMLNLIERELRRDERGAALEDWAELTGSVPDAEPAPALCVRLAQALSERGRGDEAAVLLRRALLQAGNHLPPANALRIAEVGLRVDPRIAAAAARTALARPDLDPESRSRLERLLERATPIEVG
jgi:tetratricopeptide (TPR) repeat protein